MPFLRHLVLAAAYTVIAAAVAIVLPQVAPEFDFRLSVVIGMVVLLTCALLHEVFTRQDEEARIIDELYDMRVTAMRVMKELRETRAEAARISRDMAAPADRTQAHDLEQDMRRLQTEMKVLQTLVDELPGGSRKIARISEAPRASLTSEARGTDREADDTVVLAALEDALKRDSVEIALQPIVALPQRRIRFYEAFTRVRAANGQVFTPDQYVAIAEREKLIAAVDNVLLFRSVQLLRKVQKKTRGMAFFCNISPHSLADNKFFNEFLDFVGENAELAPSLVFEFSQSIVANGDTSFDSHLNRLREMGFKFSMDQVASVNLDIPRLAERGFRYVKIGHDLLLAEQARPSTDISMVDMKRLLARHAIQLIAEKIETEQKLLEVLDLDVDYGQGFLFGEPRVSLAAAAA
jgi:cyclic-di-GMP phosphodiesterase TipF (flagellum assembly factor)